MVEYRIDVVLDPSGAQSGSRTVERALGSVEDKAEALRRALQQGADTLDALVAPKELAASLAAAEVSANALRDSIIGINADPLVQSLETVEVGLQKTETTAEDIKASFEGIFSGSGATEAIASQEALQESLGATKQIGLLCEEEINALMGVSDQGSIAAVDALGAEAAKATSQFQELRSAEAEASGGPSFDPAGAQALNTALADIAKALHDLGKEGKHATDELGAGLHEAHGHADALVHMLHNLLAVVGLHAVAHEALELAEAYEQVGKKLSNVIDSTEELEHVTEQLFEVAKASRTGFAETASTFLKVSVAFEGLGKSQEEALRFTELLGKSIATSGASAGEAQGAVHSLAFAFQNGAINGRQLQSVLQTLPEIGKLLAAELGVTRTSLKEMANQGLVTSTVLVDALEHAAGAIDARAARIPETIGQAFTALNNSFEKFIGHANETTHTTDIIAHAILNLSEHAAGLSIAIGGVSSVILLSLVGKALPALNAALLGNPITAVAVGVFLLTATIIELVHKTDDFSEATKKAAVVTDEWNDALARVNASRAARASGDDAALAALNDETAAALRLAKAMSTQGKAAFTTAVKPLQEEIDILRIASAARLDYATAIKVETELRKQSRHLASVNVAEITKLAQELDIEKARVNVYKEQLGPQRELASALAAVEIEKGKSITSQEAYTAAVERAEVKFRSSTEALLSGAEKAALALQNEEQVTRALIAARGEDAESIKQILALQQSGAGVSVANQVALVLLARRNDLSKAELKVVNEATSAQREYDIGIKAIDNDLAKHVITKEQAAIQTLKLTQATLAGRDPFAASLQGILEETAALQAYINSEGKSIALIKEEIKVRQDLGGLPLTPEQQKKVEKAVDDSAIVAEQTRAKQELVGATQELEIRQRALNALVEGSAAGAKIYTGALIDNTRAKEDNARVSGLSTGAKQQLQALDQLRGSQIEYGRAVQDIDELVRTRTGNEALSITEIAQLRDAATVNALAGATSLEAGYTRAFAKMRIEARDFASVAEKVVNAFASKAEEAIYTFVQGGTVHFKDLARSLLQEVEKIIIRLLVLQLIEAATGTAPAGGGGGLGLRAAGGPVEKGRSYIVGEQGPELFTPAASGNITPQSQPKIATVGQGAPPGSPAPAEAPQVHVSVVNVTDPDMIPREINSGRADTAIINAIGRNRTAVKKTMG